MEKRIGLIGSGSWGKNILRNLNDLDVLHSVCDSDLGILKEREKSYSGINFTSQSKDLLDNPEIKAVAIATTAATHYALTKDALTAGKDVFVEKPLALTIKEAEELVKLAEKNDKILMVGHILQYHPAIIKLKEMVDNGEIGKLQYIYSNRLNLGKLRTEENILWSFAPHDISVILMLLNENPVNVSSFGGEYITKSIYDTTMTNLEFKNGVKAHIFVSWLHPFKEQKLVVVGTKSMVVFNGLNGKALTVYPHRIQYKNGKIPVAQKAECHMVDIESAEPLKEEMIHFINCIENRKKPKTDGIEGLNVLKVLERAEQSMRNTARISLNPGWNKNYFVHESAVVDDDVLIGENTKIWHFSHILKNSKIGKNCVAGQNVMIGPDVTIGNNCKLQNNVSVYKEVTLEDDVFCGPSCVFTNVYTPRALIERKDEFLPTLVKKGATIGANATVLCGVTIGKYAMIGAGAVVKKDVPDNALVVGVPAKQIGWVCKCGVTLKFKDKHATCSYCGVEYILKKDYIQEI